jgi:hypothetical protein
LHNNAAQGAGEKTNKVVPLEDRWKPKALFDSRVVEAITTATQGSYIELEIPGKEESA